MKMRSILTLLSLSLTILISTSCNIIEKIKHKTHVIEHYEQASLSLAKENRELKKEIGELQFDIQKLKSKIQFLELQLTRKKCLDSVSGDTVKFDTYQWSPEQLLTMAQKSFNEEKYLDAANYFDSYLSKYPDDKNINDQIIFQAGVSSYKSEKHYVKAIKYLGLLIEKYPASPYYRGSKLWLALAQYQKGNKKFFYDTVEEFRKKYRNTSEWNILSAYYEKFRLESSTKK